MTQFYTLLSQRTSDRFTLVWSILLTLCLSGGAVGLTSCSSLARFGLGVTPIEKVMDQPTAFEDVTLRGKVINQVGLFGKGAYQIQDQSGSIWVATDSGLPGNEEMVTVKGRVSEGLAIGGRNFGVIVEETERF